MGPWPFDPFPVLSWLPAWVPGGSPELAASNAAGGSWRAAGMGSWSCRWSARARTGWRSLTGCRHGFLELPVICQGQDKKKAPVARKFSRFLFQFPLDPGWKGLLPRIGSRLPLQASAQLCFKACTGATGVTRGVQWSSGQRTARPTPRSSVWLRIVVLPCLSFITARTALSRGQIQDRPLSGKTTWAGRMSQDSVGWRNPSSGRSTLSDYATTTDYNTNQ